MGETDQVLQRDVDLNRYVLTLICSVVCFSQVSFGWLNLHCTFGLDTTSLTNTMYASSSAFHSSYCRALPLGDMIEDAPFTIVTRCQLVNQFSARRRNSFYEHIQMKMATNTRKTTLTFAPYAIPLSAMDILMRVSNKAPLLWPRGLT